MTKSYVNYQMPPLSIQSVVPFAPWLFASKASAAIGQFIKNGSNAVRLDNTICITCDGTQEDKDLLIRQVSEMWGSLDLPCYQIDRSRADTIALTDYTFFKDETFESFAERARILGEQILAYAKAQGMDPLDPEFDFTHARAAFTSDVLGSKLNDLLEPIANVHFYTEEIAGKLTLQSIAYQNEPKRNRDPEVIRLLESCAMANNLSELTLLSRVSHPDYRFVTEGFFRNGFFLVKFRTAVMVHDITTDSVQADGVGVMPSVLTIPFGQAKLFFDGVADDEQSIDGIVPNPNS